MSSRTPRGRFEADASRPTGHERPPHADASLKQRLKRAVGPTWQFRVHRLGRLRWITKFRLMQRFGTDVALRHRVAYVLWNPETESFSYDIANEAELVATIAAALGRPESDLAAYAAETRRDAELNESLARHLRRRVDVRRRQPLGNRLAWYLIVRATKPGLVVETGIYQGLGSLVLLRALEQNRREGFPGELMSFDINPHAGGVVRPDIRQHWHRVIGSTGELLASALEGREVGMFVQDTPHTQQNQAHEFGVVLAHAAPHLIMVDSGGGQTTVLEDLCATHRGAYHALRVRSREHVYPGADIRFASFGSGLSPGGDETMRE